MSSPLIATALILTNLLLPVECKALDPRGGDILSGGILVERVTSEHGIHGLRAAFMVRASRRAIWTLLTSYEQFREIFDGLEEVQVVTEDESGARVRYRIRVAWLRYQYTLQRAYLDKERHIAWHLVEGDLRSVSGYWKIHDGPDPERQVLEYESFVDVGRIVPTALVAERASAEFRKTASRIRERLEYRPGSK
jgi:ribosome-associated toxin RatA of RatAB toxin-antitoxin module